MVGVAGSVRADTDDLRFAAATRTDGELATDLNLLRGELQYFPFKNTSKEL